MHLLDTNILSLIEKGDTEIIGKTLQLEDEKIITCSIVLAEINAGLEKFIIKYGVESTSKKQKFYNYYLENKKCVNFYLETAKVFGSIKGRLLAAGKTVSDADIMIASCAVEASATLVTRNAKDFFKIQKVSDLRLEVW